MSVLLNPATNPRVQSVIITLCQMLGINVDISDSKSFRVVLDCPDGNGLTFQATPYEKGPPQRLVIVRPNQLMTPSVSSNSDKISEGVVMLVNSVATVTLPKLADGSGAVPAGAVIYASHNTFVGVVTELAITRINDDSFFISSGMGAYASAEVVDVATTYGLVSGQAVFNLENHVGDVLAVREVSPLGTVADAFTVARVDDLTVRVEAFAGGILQVGNGSTVQVINFGKSGYNNSQVRWAVVRP